MSDEFYSKITTIRENFEIGLSNLSRILRTSHTRFWKLVREEQDMTPEEADRLSRVLRASERWASMTIVSLGNSLIREDESGNSLMSLMMSEASDEEVLVAIDKAAEIAKLEPRRSRRRKGKMVNLREAQKSDLDDVNPEFDMIVGWPWYVR